MRLAMPEFVVVDEPTELPDGTEIELLPVDDDFDAEERARLLQAIDDGIEDFERGDHMDGFDFIAQMRARFTPRRFTPPKGAQLVPDRRKWRGSAQGA
jgi:hypothetical protein